MGVQLAFGHLRKPHICISAIHLPLCGRAGEGHPFAVPGHCTGSRSCRVSVTFGSPSALTRARTGGSSQPQSRPRPRYSLPMHLTEGGSEEPPAPKLSRTTPLFFTAEEPKEG